MNIGIIGSGNIGSGLGRIWAQKAHRILFSFSRDAAKLAALAASVPNAAAATPRDAVEQSEVILFSVKWSDVGEALRAAGPLEGKILIDCTNPLTPDAGGLIIGQTTSAAEEIAKLAPAAKVVKAFNTVFAEVYHSSSPLFGSRRATVFYCGDDENAKKKVARLIADASLEPVDAGELKAARYLEPMAMLMIQLGFGKGLGTNIALSLIRR